jgi:hypothetical protein
LIENGISGLERIDKTQIKFFVIMIGEVNDSKSKRTKVVLKHYESVFGKDFWDATCVVVD